MSNLGRENTDYISRSHRHHSHDEDLSNLFDIALHIHMFELPRHTH